MAALTPISLSSDLYTGDDSVMLTIPVDCGVNGNGNDNHRAL